MGDRRKEILMNTNTIQNTRSEKYLGTIINDTLSWKEHLYGEKWREEEKNNQGLIPILIKRLGIIKKLSSYTNKHNLKIFIEGILMSKMRYSLPIMMNIWHEEKYREKESIRHSPRRIYRDCRQYRTQHCQWC